MPCGHVDMYYTLSCLYPCNINHQIKMNTKSVAIFLIAIFANLSSFESSSKMTFDPSSSDHSISPGSASSPVSLGSKRKFDLVKDIQKLRESASSADDIEFWNSIKFGKVETAIRMKNRGYFLDSTHLEDCEYLSELLGSDETPFESLDFLYNEFPEVFKVSFSDQIEESPFYGATSRNIDYMKMTYPNDENLMRNIREAVEARRREIIDGTLSDYN